MTKLTIEINCDGQKCGDCQKQYGDLVKKYFRYCGLFQTYLGDSRSDEIMRSPKCLAAEVNHAV